MRVVFDRFREHGLKLKPSKCEVFKTEINYLAHHVSKRGVLPSKKNLEAIARCPPPDTYTKVKSCWTHWSLQAFHQGVCQYHGPFVRLDQWGKQRQEVRTS